MPSRSRPVGAVIALTIGQTGSSNYGFLRRQKIVATSLLNQINYNHVKNQIGLLISLTNACWSFETSRLHW